MKVSSILLSSLLAGADLGAKYYVEKQVEDKEERRIFHGRGILRKVHNHGLMLNALEEQEKILRVASLPLFGIFVLFQARLLKKRGHAAEKLGAALMAGGAASNTFDRVVRGYVVDYLAVKTPWKKLTDITFNLGDLAIFAGALFTAAGAWRAKE